MSSEDKKALVRRFYEAHVKGDLDALRKMMAPDFADRSLRLDQEESDREAYIRGIAEDRAAFSDTRFTIEDQIAEGDKVVTRLTAYGKHEGDLPGAPRTGNELKMTSVTIHRIADGKLAEKWSEKDVLGFLQQIGVIPRLGGGKD